MLVGHGPRRHSDGSVVQGAYQHVDLRAQAGTGKLFWKTPKFAPARDGRLVIQEHAMGVAALSALERDRYDLPGFGIVAETGRIRHANEFVFDDGLGDLERFWHHSAEPFGIRAVGDNQVLAVDETVGPRRKDRQ